MADVKDVKIKLPVKCSFCSKTVVLEVTEQQLDAYNKGAYVQTAFPTMSADDREMLISGMCPACWKKTFD